MRASAWMELASGVVPWARRVFGLDVRSLALFRVGLGVAVLTDVATRLPDLVAHYTDAGLLSRSDAIEHFRFLHDWGVSLHLAGGSWFSQGVLFGLAAGAGVGLVVGWRTRWMTVLAWVLTASVQLRNLYIGGGYDAALRLLLLWGCFLPLGAAASLDARRSRGDRTVGPPPPHLSIASVALFAQVFFLYGGAGWGKLQIPAWWDGTALSLILQDDMRVAPIGSWLLTWPALCEAATYVIPWLELSVPLLLVSPLARGPVRTAAAAILISMNVGFGLTLEVGWFPLIASVAVLAFLPSWIWDGALARVAPSRANAAAPDEGGPVATAIPRSRWPAEVVAAVLLIYSVVWNVGVARDPGFQLPRSAAWFGDLVFLRQDWRMFAQPATRTGWLVVPGRLRDGTEVDLLAAGGPAPSPEDPSDIAGISWERPPSPSRQYDNDRWRNLLVRSVRGTGTRARLNLYGRYMCRSWNAAHHGAETLVGFEIWWMVTDLPAAPGGRKYDRELIWSHDCFA